MRQQVPFTIVERIGVLIRECEPGAFDTGHEVSRGKTFQVGRGDPNVRRSCHISTKCLIVTFLHGLDAQPPGDRRPATRPDGFDDRVRVYENR
jgi:hypothetical protein